MDKAIKAEWVAALRSGEYRQAREQLCTDDGRMCCLGVLIDACIDGEWEEMGADHYWPSTHAGWSFAGSSTGLNVLLRDRLGISTDEADALIELNDVRRYKFPAIAKWIEKNL